MLLTSAGSPALRGRRAAIFAATLVKPVKQSELLDAIVTAFAAPRRGSTPRARNRRVGLRRAARVLRVLVAEDNPTNQKLVSALLDQHGHHVSIVGNGRLAVERAAQEPFDIILMDVQMPEMSGLEATAAIREAERHTGRHIPIVALTARAMAGDREQCLAAGMDAYVSKPVQCGGTVRDHGGDAPASQPAAPSPRRRPAREQRRAPPDSAARAARSISRRCWPDLADEPISSRTSSTCFSPTRQPC